MNYEWWLHYRCSLDFVSAIISANIARSKFFFFFIVLDLLNDKIILNKRNYTVIRVYTRFFIKLIKLPKLLLEIKVRVKVMEKVFVVIKTYNSYIFV